MKKLVELPVSKIYPHPHNPRKELGDLKELTESIKANGVLQNLTVVKTNEMDTYTVIIGHRRLAAAKAAGLETVPCYVAKLDKKEQLEMMLTENVQRSDLTLLEEADGMQMVLDLGVSSKQLAKDLGLSETTVKRKTGILKNDREKLEAAQLRGGTLKDYLELDKITDPEEKSKVLDTIGTANFNCALRAAIDKQELKKYLDIIEEQVGEFAMEQTYEFCRKHRFVAAYRGYDKSETKVEAPKDADTVQYWFVRQENGSWGSIEIYKEEPEVEQKDDEPDREEEAEQWVDEQEAKLHEIEMRHEKLRMNFIIGYPKKKIGAHIESILRYLMIAAAYSRKNPASFYDLMGIKHTDNWDCKPERESLDKALEKNVEYYVLVYAVTMLTNNYSNSYMQTSYNLSHPIAYRECPELDLTYELLTELGYEMSQEEKDMQSGKLIESVQKEYAEAFSDIIEEEEEDDE